MVSKKKKLHIHIFQHVKSDVPKSISDWLEMRGHSYEVTKFPIDPTLPDIEDIDWLIVLGGPMSVHDEDKLSWLKSEKDFIKKMIDAQKPVLGFCLGGQLVAQALGAEVYKAKLKEVGWYPVYTKRGFGNNKIFKYFPDTFTAFHWHTESFSLPEGARVVASSPACENQIIVYDNNVVAIQCHLELDPEIIEKYIGKSADFLVKDDFVQTAEEIRSNMTYSKLSNDLLHEVLTKMEKEARAVKRKRRKEQEFALN